MVKYKEVILEEFGRDYGTIKDQIIKFLDFLNVDSVVVDLRKAISCEPKMLLTTVNALF